MTSVSEDSISSVWVLGVGCDDRVVFADVDGRFEVVGTENGVRGKTGWSGAVEDIGESDAVCVVTTCMGFITGCGGAGVAEVDA